MRDMELPEIVAVCPSCGSEFQPHVMHCIDCGTPTRSCYLKDRVNSSQRNDCHGDRLQA